MEQQKTSIIILAYKEPKRFKKMFEILLKNTYQSNTPFEIIVVDNNAEKELKEYINQLDPECNFKLITNTKNLGTSKGFNQGARYSTGHYLCFFNSDYYMNVGWLESMITCFEHRPKIGLVSCTTNITGNLDEAFDVRMSSGVPIQPAIPSDYKESDCAIAQMFTTRDIWNEVDGFSEEFFFGFEDLDFNEKIKEKGYKIFVNRKTFGFHDHDSEVKALDEGHKQMSKSRDTFRKKWGDKYRWA